MLAGDSELGWNLPAEARDECTVIIPAISINVDVLVMELWISDLLETEKLLKKPGK